MHHQGVKPAQELLPVRMRLPIQPEDGGQKQQHNTHARDDAIQTELDALSRIHYASRLVTTLAGVVPVNF